MIFTDITFQTNTIKLLSRILDVENPIEPIFPFRPQKPKFKASEKISPLPRKTPSAAYVSPQIISEFLDELNKNPELDMHSVMIVKDGAVIAGAEWGDYSLNTWRVTHSECKSIVSLAIGILIGDKKLSLDDKVSDFFASELSFLGRITRPNLTVRHLLTMSSGVVFNELGAATEEDFLNAFFESASKFPAGKSFDYNSMNSFVLSALVKKITETSISEFLSKRLFSPLGITDFYWEKCRKNIEMGGWGLYMLPEDMAKIGILVLNGGKYNGEQLIPESYIKEAITPKMFPKGNGDFAYGYHIWVGKSVKSFLFNGMFGQNMLAYPENNIIIVSNASNAETFQQGPFYAIANRFFGHSIEKKKSLTCEIKLKKDIKSLKNEKFTLIDLPREARALNGACFELNEGKASSVGLMPLTLSLLRSNYTKGITGVSFSVKKYVFIITFSEGGISHSFPVGFKRKRISEFNYFNESFQTAIRGDFYKNRKNETVLKLRLSFLELSNARTMSFIFKDDGKITLKMAEIPNKRFLTAVIDNSLSQIPSNLIAKSVKNFIGKSSLAKRSDELFNPVLRGKRVK